MKQNKKRVLRWVRRPRAPIEELGLLPLRDLPEPNPLRDLILEIGIPTSDALTPVEDAFNLLQSAAEIEHALMVQYLYALYSLKQEPDTNELQDALQTIAIQEMGHLMTIQNLLLLIGEGPYMSRQDISPQPEKDPIPFRLEPLTKHSLAKYVAAESPVLPLNDPGTEELKAIFDEARIASATEIHRVGLIYAAIYWLFQKTDEIEPPWMFLPADRFQPGWHVADADLRLNDNLVTRQADLSEWGASVSDLFIDSTETRERALEAIFRIASQGEGLENMKGSHFDRLRTAYRGFNSLPQPPHLDVPTDPTFGSDPLADPFQEHNRITNARTRVWVKLFDQRYHLLLLCLQHTFIYDKSDPVQRKIRVDLKNWSMQEMRRGLRPIAQELSTQPRFEGETVPATFVAAAAFSLDPETSGFPQNGLEQWQLHERLNVESLALIGEIQNLTDLTASEMTCLNGLRTVSSSRLNFIRAQITENGG